MSTFTIHFRMKDVFSEAEGYLELGMPQHALEVLERCAPYGWEHRTEFLYLQAEALRELDRLDEAAGVLEEALVHDPSELRLRLALGWCRLGMEQPEHTLEVLRAAENDAYGSRFQVLFLRGLALRDLERYEEAAGVLEDSLAEEPDQARARLALGWCRLGMNDPRGTLNVLEGLEVSRGCRAQLLFLRGVAHRDVGEFEPAIDLLREASRRSPHNVHVWLALAGCFKRAGRMASAVEALKAGLQADDAEAAVRYNLACCWSLTGDRDRAMRFLAEAVAIDADYRLLSLEEPDFDPIRKDVEFQTLVGQ
ncbi:MAG: tetratricopeptide repeat protein [Planctomycetales bacterium]